VALLVEALRYKPEVHGFDIRSRHWAFPITYSFRPHYEPGVDSSYYRNDYQNYNLGVKGGRCVGLTLPPSCADCLEILGAPASWSPRGPPTCV
jgi:hypothetical protein